MSITTNKIAKWNWVWEEYLKDEYGSFVEEGCSSEDTSYSLPYDKSKCITNKQILNSNYNYMGVGSGYTTQTKEIKQSDFKECIKLTYNVTYGHSIKLYNNYSGSTGYITDIWCQSYLQPSAYGAEQYFDHIDGNVSTAMTLGIVYMYFSGNTLPASAFTDCTALTSIELSSNITNLSNACFSGCTSLTSITINGEYTGTTIPSKCFCGCVSLENFTIPDSVTTISSFCFDGCTSLKKCELKSSITRINAYAFRYCTQVNVKTLQYITYFGGYCFLNCQNLPIHFNSRKNIDFSVYAFKNTNIKYIYLANLGSNFAESSSAVFADCTDLKHAHLTSTVSCALPGNFFSGCTSLTSVTLSDNFTTIRAKAFYGCEALESFTCPSGLTRIGASDSLSTSTDSIYGSTFSGCTSLSEFTFNNALTAISCYSFAGTALCTIELPSSLSGTSAFIGSHAFYNCSSLSLVRCNATTPCVIYGGPNGSSANPDVFSGVSTSGRIIVPSTYKSAYVATATTATNSWYKYSSYIMTDDGNDNTINLIYNITNTGSTTLFSTGLTSYITSMKINDSSVTISNTYTFTSTGIKNVKITVTASTLPNASFAGNSYLQTVVIKKSWALPSYGFANCPNLKSIYFNSASIGTYCFSSDTNLINITSSVGVTTIGTSAFNSCSSLNTWKPFENAVSFGNYAFKYCYSLTDITINANPATGCFQYCYGLKNVNIGDNVTILNISSFSGCTSLTSVTMGSGVTTIYARAFASCSSLREITITSTANTSYVSSSGGTGSFEGVHTGGTLYCHPGMYQYHITNGFCKNDSTLHNLKYYNWNCSVLPYTIAYSGNATSSLLSTAENVPTNVSSSNSSEVNGWHWLTFDDDLYEIPSSEFSNCSQITKIILPLTIEQLYSTAFKGCTSLTSISGCTNVFNIDEQCFMGCTSLYSCDFNSSNLVYLQKGAFYNCQSLTTPIIPTCSIFTCMYEGTFFGCKSITNLYIPSNVVTIEKECFAGCTGLSQVTMVNVTEIWDNSFRSIRPIALNSLLSNSPNLRYLGYQCFYGCTTSAVTIPNNVTEIDCAFSHMTSLTGVTISTYPSGTNTNYFWPLENSTGVTTITYNGTTGSFNSSVLSRSGEIMNSAAYWFGAGDSGLYSVDDVPCKEITCTNGTINFTS